MDARADILFALFLHPDCPDDPDPAAEWIAERVPAESAADLAALIRREAWPNRRTSIERDIARKRWSGDVDLTTNRLAVKNVALNTAKKLFSKTNRLLDQLPDDPGVLGHGIRSAAAGLRGAQDVSRTALGYDDITPADGLDEEDSVIEIIVRRPDAD